MTLGIDFRDGDDAVLPIAEPVISDLLRLGLLEEDRSQTKAGLRLADESLRLFLPMLSRFDVRLVAVKREGCPLAFCTGLLKGGDVVSHERALPNRTIPGGGQGETDAIAAIGCIGELSERLSLCSLGNSDNRIFQKVIGQPEVDFACLLGQSEFQRRNMAREIGIKADEMKLTGPDWEGLSERRVALRRLADGLVAACPSFGVLFQEFEQTTGRRLSYASSVGCAVWQTLEGARERAMLELVERDAIAQAWYNRLGITLIGRSFLEEILPPELLDYLTRQERTFGLYSVETDLAVQVVMAISHNGEGRFAAFGSAGSWDIATAAKGAVRELLQSENALTLMDRSYPASADGGNAPRQLSYARHRSILNDLPLGKVQETVGGQLERRFSYDDLLQSCSERGIDIWEFDATRQDLGIPCVKLLSPHLCGWEPRFGKARLYQGVVDRGLRSSPAEEAEFAARPFPF